MVKRGNSLVWINAIGIVASTGSFRTVKLGDHHEQHCDIYSTSNVISGQEQQLLVDNHDLNGNLEHSHSRHSKPTHNDCGRTVNHIMD